MFWFIVPFVQSIGETFDFTVVLASLPVFPVSRVFLPSDIHVVGQVANLDDCGNLVLHDFAKIFLSTRSLVVGKMTYSLPYGLREEHAQIGLAESPVVKDIMEIPDGNNFVAITVIFKEFYNSLDVRHKCPTSLVLLVHMCKFGKIVSSLLLAARAFITS